MKVPQDDWGVLSSGLMYKAERRGRPRNPPEHQSLMQQALAARRDAAAERRAESAKRTASMVEMYKRGLSLDAIGKHFGVTRERVRQLTTKAGAKRAGFAARAVISDARKAAKREAIDARRMAKSGVSKAEWDAWAKAGVTASYRGQRGSAKTRGIPWEMNFSEWLSVWLDSGKMEQRGRGKDKYCMSRIGDKGSYKVGNVEIKTNAENAREGFGRRGRGVKPFPGVFLCYAGTSRPWVATFKGRQIGCYASQEEAAEARASLMSASEETKERVAAGIKRLPRKRV